MSNELSIVLVVLAVGLSPLAMAILRGRAHRHRLIAVGILSFALAAFVLDAGLTNSRPSGPAAGVPRVVHEDGYVGSDACRSCHPYEYATWHASYHRSMTQLAGPDSIRAPFDGTVLDLEGVTWRVERRGNAFWVHGKEGATEVERRVAMVTGSHNYQLYWLESERQDGLAQFPLVYFLHDEIWIPRKARFLQPPAERTPIETGRWRSHCIKCHATRGRKEAPPSGETRVAELGISCEMCHGPGGEHIAANRTPLRRYFYHLSGKPDPTIVNPRRLPHDRSTDVCAQCHSIEIFLSEDKAKNWMREGTHYRPGEHLASFQTTVIGRYEDNPPGVRQYLDSHQNSFQLHFCFWSDGELRVTGREYHGMLESPCYQRGDMSCLSCHTMHRPDDDGRSLGDWAEDQLRLGMRGDTACLQCHRRLEKQAELVAHTHHLADSTGSRCYNCHMPYTSWGLLKAIRSHKVGSPSVAASLATGRPNACNQCHLDQTLAWTAEKLDAWYRIKSPALSQDEQETAASILWSLRGDAGQRALMAWSMGWAPAREASGTQWMVPYLTALILDSYHAVRYNAQRSLAAYPEYADLCVDSVVGATKSQQMQMARKILGDWEHTFPSSFTKEDPRLLIRSDGGIDQERFRRIGEQRDNRILVLFE